MNRRGGNLYSYLATFVLTCLLILVCGHFLLGAWEWLNRGKKFDADLMSIDARAFAAVYANRPEREAIFEYSRYDRTHFEPYVHFRRDPITTKYVNVDETGLRKTVKSPRIDARKVFVLGGSTVWGTGSSDDATIPSIIQSSLGAGFDVHNFGETGYVSAQELNQLLKALADGNVPDCVIFYDGNNDGYAGGYSPAVPRDPQKLRIDAQDRQRADREAFYRFMRDWFEPSNYSSLFWRAKAQRIKNWEGTIVGHEAERAQKVIAFYEAHIRQVKALGKEYGFSSYFFWQPNMFNPSRTPVSYEREIMESASPVLVESQRQVYYEAKKVLGGREGEDVFFIGDLFNDVAEPVYLDWSHTTMEGNRIVADRIVRSINKCVEKNKGKKVAFALSQSSAMFKR